MRSLWLRVFCLGVIVAGVALVSAPSPATPACNPPAGDDTFANTDAEVAVDTDDGRSDPSIKLDGPTKVHRGPVAPDGTIPTEMLQLDLHSTNPSPAYGNVLVRLNPGRPTIGKITPRADGRFDSFFDVFVEVETDQPGRVVAYNDLPVRMSSVIPCPPPRGAVYQSPPDRPQAADLYLRQPPLLPNLPPPANGPLPPLRRIGRIRHAKHIPMPERPWFSVRPNGTSGLDPATVYTTTAPGGPAIVVVPRTTLKLDPKDNIDALSGGPDGSVAPNDHEFSVRKGSQGVLPSAVRTEATQSPPSAHGDLFNALVPNTNALWIDEGTLGLKVPNDDVDAAQDPSRFVYFSLQNGSPTLTAIGASGGDILTSVQDGITLPTIAVSHTSLGLVAADDLDGLCNCPPPPGSGEVPLFSLAPGSPSLGTIPASPADLLVPGPQVAVSAATIGLLSSDDVDALKCFGIKARCVQPVFFTQRHPGPSNPSDFDGDGLPNPQEAALGTDPNNPDSDGDLIIDGQEVGEVGTNPTLPDSDFDAINDGMEALFGGTGTNPNNPDTDGDGINDGTDPQPLCA